MGSTETVTVGIICFMVGFFLGVILVSLMHAEPEPEPEPEKPIVLPAPTIEWYRVGDKHYRVYSSYECDAETLLRHKDAPYLGKQVAFWGEVDGVRVEKSNHPAYWDVYVSYKGT